MIAMLASFRAAPLLLLVLLYGSPGWSSDDPIVLEARQRWKEGVAAFENGNMELARAAFAQAYALQPKPVVLRNLGEAEVAGGHYAAGANHLAQYLREADEVDTEQRALVERSIAKATPFVGRLVLTSDVIGAQVFVEDELLGITPIDRVYLEPGWREVRLNKGGREVRKLVEATAGTRVALHLPFSELDEPTTPATSAPVASATPHDTSSSLKWPVVISGGVLAVAGLGAGGYFLLRSNSLANDALALRSDLGGQGSGACLNATDHRCQELDQTVRDGQRAERLAAGGFIAGGALAVGTVLAWWLWPSSQDEGVGSVRAAPLYDSWGGAALWGGTVSGSF